MKKESFMRIINVCIGVWMLIYGIWSAYGGVHAIVNFFGKEANGEYVRIAYSMFLWIIMLVDYLLNVVFGILKIYPFVYKKSGKYICTVAGINLLYVFVMDILYYRELGFTMIQLNPKRLVFPIIMMLIGVWWQYYYKKNEKQLSSFFPFVCEFSKLAKSSFTRR